MANLESIEVRVEGLDGTHHSAQNALPLLHEIRHALARLAESGEPTIIDLSAIPFGPGDRDKLFQALGQGEVSATVNALGETRIDETAYPGVWLIRHHSPMGDELATHIEITRQPSMLITPEEDLGASASRLADYLNKDNSDIP